jgi:hypothetical protein
MRNIIVGASVLALTACSGMNEAITKYGSTRPVSYQISGQNWRIYDQPENGRLMITPSLSAAAGQGAVSGITYGMADNPYTQREAFEPPAVAYLASKGCKITGGHLVLNTQFEFEYSC